MRPPRNINDLTKCVQYLNNRVWVWCVECTSWTEVRLTCEAKVVCNQSGNVVKFLSKSDPVFTCSRCQADVGYLLSQSQQFRLRDWAGFKNPAIEVKIIEAAAGAEPRQLELL